MLALSLRQPWPWLILRPDIKDPAERARLIAEDKIKSVENRTWITKHRGPVWIHAGNSTSEVLDVEYGIRERFGISIPMEYDYGGIVGVAEIVDVVRTHPSRWFVGPYGFVLKNQRPVKFFEMKGRLLLFETGLELGDLEEI